MTRRAIGSYEVGASDEEKGRALRMAIDDAVAELIGDLGENPDDVLEHCESAVENAADDAGRT